MLATQQLNTKRRKADFFLTSSWNFWLAASHKPVSPTLSSCSRRRENNEEVQQMDGTFEESKPFLQCAVNVFVSTAVQLRALQDN